MATTPLREHPDSVRLLDCPAPDRHVLVIGGGRVAARRVDTLARSTSPADGAETNRAPPTTSAYGSRSISTAQTTA